MRNTAAVKIDEAVTIGLNCLELDLEDKGIIKQVILAEISRYYFPIWDVQTPEELPVIVFEILYEQLGIGFDVHNGKIQAVSIERKEPVLSGFERLFGRVASWGIDFGSRPSIGVLVNQNQKTDSEEGL